MVGSTGGAWQLVRGFCGVKIEQEHWPITPRVAGSRPFGGRDLFDQAPSMNGRCAWGDVGQRFSEFNRGCTDGLVQWSARRDCAGGPPRSCRVPRTDDREQMISGATRLAKVRRFVAGSAVQLSFPPPEFRPAKACGNMFMTTPIA